MDIPTVILSGNNKVKKGLYVSLACSQCRSNHRRCNGEAPCSRCRNLNVQCIYTQTKPRGGYRGRKIRDTPPNKKEECFETHSNEEPAVDLHVLLNVYSEVYYQTPEFQFCPFRLPNPDCISSACPNFSIAFVLTIITTAPDHKFQVLSSISYAALTLGHLSQGHALMDQAKQYLSQAMSSTNLESAVGFYYLGLCHLMENDNTVGLNYLKMCKTISTTVYNKQASEGRTDLFVNGPYESSPLPQSIALKMRYYHAIMTIATSFKSLQKTLESLTRFTQKWNHPLWNSMLEMTTTTIFLRFCTTEIEVLNTIQSIENLNGVLNSNTKCLPPLYSIMFRAIKFAFLRNYSAMNEECDQFIDAFKTLHAHDYVIIKVTFLWSRLFRLFSIPNAKIQELMAHVHHLSANYPGYTAAFSMGPKPTRDPLDLLLQRRLTCSEEYMVTTTADLNREFRFEDLPIVFEECFNFEAVEQPF